jgi:PAS domain S-box-containing protein
MSWLRIWSDLNLRTKGLIVVAVPAAATVAIACASYLIESRGAAADYAADKEARIVETGRELKSSETETSAHVRAYFITADDSFRDELRGDLAKFDKALERLASLLADNPRRSGDVQRIGAIHRARVEELFGAVARFRSASLSKEQLRSILRAKETRRLEIVGVLDAMEAEESGLREASRQQAGRLRAELRAATLIFALLGVVGGAAISLLFASGITRRVETLRRSVARLKTGGPLEPLEGKDEIGALSEGIAVAAEILAHRNAALENALDGIAQADASGHYVSFNKAYGELMGLDANSAPATILASVHPDDRWKVEEAIGRMQLSGKAETEARIVREAGGAVDVGATFLPVAETRGSGYYVFLRDITRQKEVEGALVRTRNAALAAGVMRLEFLAKISHDIRTPLNAIFGAADLLSRTPLDPRQSEYVGLFQRNCRRLVTLINDFLDFSRLEAGVVKVEKIPFRVRETADEAVLIFRDTALRKGVRLYASVAPDVPEWQLGDPVRIQQILVNLLSNALKFTDAGHVGLEVKTGGGRLHFEVSDTGAGIRPEDQDRIFAAFMQLPNQNPRTGRGSGLGLTICKELLDLMGGEIGVVSEEGRGSKFCFSLRLQAVGQSGPCVAVEPPALQWPEGRDPARILIAEDTDDNRLLCAAYLREEPVEIRFAVNGREAVDAVRSGEDFDLIFMDLDMPVVDGYQAASAIRDWERAHGASATPIVALSAHAMQEAVHASLRAGCVAHIAKPVDRNALLGAVLRYARSTARRRPEPATLPDEVSTLASGYLDAKPAQIQQARNCLASRDFDPIRRFGHNLKGTGTGYGFPGIGEIGSEIEKAAAEGDAERIASQLETLYRIVNQEVRNRAEVLDRD